MKKIKRLLIVFIVFCALAVGGLVLSLNSVVEQLRPEIEKRAAEIVGVPVKVGRISSALFPSIQVELNDVNVGQGDFQLGKALLAVPLADLIKGKLNVSAITLDSLKVAVEHGKDLTKIGGIDLSHLGKNASVANKEATPAESPNVAGATPATPATPAVTIKRISLQNSQISFTETSGAAPLKIALEDFNAELRDIESTGRADVDLSAKVLGSANKNFIVRGVVGDPHKGLPIDLSVTIDPVSLGAIQELAAKSVALPSGFSIGDSGEVKLRLRTQDKDIVISPEISLDKAAVTLQPDANKPPLFAKKPGVPLSLHGDIILDSQQSVSSKNFSITLGKTTLALPFVRSAAGAIDCTVQGKQLQLTDLGNLAQALQELKLVGESDVAVTAKLAPNSTPAISGTVGFRNIGASAGGTEFAGLGGSLDFANNSLTLSNFAGKLREIPVSGSAVILLPTDSNRIVTLRESEFGVFSGKINTRATYSLPPLPAKSSGSLPTSFENEISLTSKAVGLDLGTISKTFAPTAPVKVLGKLQSFDLSLSALAKDPKQSAHGTTNFVVSDGMIEGLNILSQSFASVAKIPGVTDSMGSLLPQALLASGSAFQQLRGSATISGPTISLSDISLYHELYEIHGSGTISTDGNAELKTQVKLLSKLTSQMLNKEKRLSLLLDKQGNMIFPVSITKTADHTVVLPDFQQLLERAAGNTAKDAAGKALDKVAPGLGGAAKGILNKLF